MSVVQCGALAPHSPSDGEGGLLGVKGLCHAEWEEDEGQQRWEVSLDHSTGKGWRVPGPSSPKLLPLYTLYLHTGGCGGGEASLCRVTQAVSDGLRTRPPGLSSHSSNWCCPSALPQYFSEYTSLV